jgi:hypothetical protein
MDFEGFQVSVSNLSEGELSDAKLSLLQPFEPKLSRGFLSKAKLCEAVRSEVDHDYKENDEVYMLESMQKELMKIENISEAFMKDLDGEDIVVLCNYDAKDNLFKFHFKHWGPVKIRVSIQESWFLIPWFLISGTLEDKSSQGSSMTYQ